MATMNNPIVARRRRSLSGGQSGHGLAVRIKMMFLHLLSSKVLGLAVSEVSFKGQLIQLLLVDQR